MTGYIDKGALFFHDRLLLNLKGFYDPGVLAKMLQPSLSATATSIIHYGKTSDYVAEHIMESGMVILDKERRMLSFPLSMMFLHLPDGFYLGSLYHTIPMML
jgi:Mannosyltransferase putative